MIKVERQLNVFLTLAFLIPLISLKLQEAVQNEAGRFVLFGIQAAAPTVSALLVLLVHGEWRTFVKRYFGKTDLCKALL